MFEQVRQDTRFFSKIGGLIPGRPAAESPDAQRITGKIWAHCGELRHRQRTTGLCRRVALSAAAKL
jgi:hypothetical protein